MVGGQKDYYNLLRALYEATSSGRDVLHIFEICRLIGYAKKIALEWQFRSYKQT